MVFSTVDWRVVFRGGSVGAVCLVAAGLLAGQGDGDGRARWWPWVYLLAALTAFGLAGYIAGLARRDVPMIHGALAALTAALVAGAVGIVRQIADGHGVSVVTAAVTAVLAVTWGVAGGLFADWHARRRFRQATKAGAGQRASGSTS